MGIQLVRQSGRVFWETAVDSADFTVPQLAGIDLPYTRAERAFDFHGYISAEAALAAWVSRALRDFADRSEGLRVIAEAQRRVFCATYTDVPLVSAFDPGLLRRARVTREELLNGEWHARWRIASAARRVQGAHGLQIPATVAGGISVVLFAGFISEHLEIVRHRTQLITLSNVPRRPVSSSSRGAIVVALRPPSEQQQPAPERLRLDASNRSGNSA